MNQKAILKIKLQSDLCAGSGYSYGNTIDSDVCYNDCGLPYIPARRLKGCLRETAELIHINNSVINDIFGISKNYTSGSLVIENAYIKSIKEIDEFIRKHNKYKDLLTQQNVLELFTSVKAQTAINNMTGVAEENSLRFTRVVNQHSPINNENLEFEAIIYFDGNYEKELKQIIKSLRHIGTKRNRGLGAVSCDVTNIEEMKYECNSQGIGDEIISIDYIIDNTSPLILSSNKNSITKTYINGQTILGALASIYLNINGKTVESTEFKDLFLNGKVKYLNAFPTIEGMERTMPIPQYINRLKKTKKIINNFTRPRKNEVIKGDEDYDIRNGNLPKKINSQYIEPIYDLTADVEIKQPVEVGIDTIYHHSKIDKSTNGEDGKLYSLEVIKENQQFVGRIIAPKKYENIIKSLLNSDRFRIGKSKSAQYGKCDVRIKTTDDYNCDYNVKAGKIVVSFISSAIFCTKASNNENSYRNTVVYNDIRNEIAKELGIDKDIEDDLSIMVTEVINSYSGVMNLKCPSYQAVKYGSSFIFELKKDIVVNHRQMGLKQHEGYGEFIVTQIHDDIYKINPISHNQEESLSNIDVVRPLLLKIMEKQIHDELLASFIRGKESIDISLSTLGKVILMLKQSINDNLKRGSQKIFTNFKERISEKSIKRKNVAREINNFINKLIDDNGLKIGTEYLKSDTYEKKYLIELGNNKNMVQEEWYYLILEILTYIKNKKKGEEQ